MSDKYSISKTNRPDYAELIEVWEASVRATHHFLNEEWIQEHKPLIRDQYFDMVELVSVKSNADGHVAFLGTLEGSIEMLFVHPKHFRKGLGQRLIRYAVDEKACTKVEVNEQNPGAREFYEKMGFVVKSRSELDGQGNPYPILHMALGQ